MNMIMSLIILMAITLVCSHRHHNTNKEGNFTAKLNQNMTCNSENCPEERGICNMDNECLCLIGYKTVHNDRYGNYECNYVQKSQMVAFLLEFIASFGLGHFYIQNYIIGSIKCLFCLAFMIITCLMPYLSSSRKKSIKINTLIPYFQCLLILIFCSWQIVDSIMFGLNYYTDGAGVELKEW